MAKLIRPKLALLIVITAFPVPAQVITTIAGTDWLLPASSFPALKAPLGTVSSVAIDAKGNLYVADTDNSMVMRISTDGLLTAFAGNGKPVYSGNGGLATKAGIAYPNSVVVDAGGTVYISERTRIRKVSADGTITTAAGTGSPNFSGDGGLATAAGFSAASLFIDSSGNLYVADSDNNRVRKISADGIIRTIAGNGSKGFSGDGGLATDAALNGATGVAVDSRGNLYIADTGNQRIRKVAPTGIITTLAGNGQQGFSGDGGPAVQSLLLYPNSVAVDSTGNLYVIDLNQRVRTIRADGTIITVAGSGSKGFSGDGGLATSATLNFPSGIALDSAGTIYIADQYNDRIRKVAAGGVISTIAGNGEFWFSGDGASASSASIRYPTGLTLDSEGNLYVSSAYLFIEAAVGNNRIRKLTADGRITTVAGGGNSFGDGGAGTEATLNYPSGIAADAIGNVYVADYGNNRVRKISPGGTITTVAGNGTGGVLGGFSGDGGPATNARLSSPTGVALDNAGNLYIADCGNQRIRKVSVSGTITTFAGSGAFGFSGDGGPASKASFNCPADVAVDSTGSLYISDLYNNRVRKVTPDGTISTVAGKGTSGFSGDGGPAISAMLYSPRGIAIDRNGNLYIADGANNRIRKAAPDGTITTVAGGGSGSALGDGGPAVKATLRGPTGVAIDAAGNLYITDPYNNRVRKVLVTSTSYLAAPAKLSFTALAGSSGLGVETVYLSSSVAGLAFTAAASDSWLRITSSAGVVPGELQVSVDATSLGPGTYLGSITITVPNAVPATTTVGLTLTVQPGTPPALAVDLQNVSFAATQGGGVLSQQLRVSNAGGGSLSYTANAATSSGGSWLSVLPATGTASLSFSASLTVTATPGSLAPGTYSGTITITGAGKSTSVPVTLSVSSPTAIILASQSALSFTAVAQGGVPLPQTFGILNTGQGSMNWAATANTLSGGNWLQISPSNGTVQRPYLDVALITVSIDPSTLAAGTYYGRIHVTASAANTPQVMTVILTVLPAGLTLGPQVFPTGLIFTGVAGVTPGSQDVQVGNPTGQLNNFQSGLIGTGFSFLPTNASMQPTQPTTVRVYPDFSNLSPGSIQQGTITLQFSDRSPSQTINVLTVVAPSGSTAAMDISGDRAAEERGYRIELGPTAASGCATQAWNVQFRSPQPSFSAVLGQATTVEVQVADGCGNLVVGQSASVVGALSSGDPSFVLTSIGGGFWQGTWKPVNASGAVTLVVIAAGNGGVWSTKPGLSGVVSATAATTPTVTAQGVVHAASDQGGVPIAPGGLITVYGVNLADGVGQSNGLPLPQQLNGTQVLLGNQPLPILYTSTGQLNVQVPYGVPVNTQYQLTVQHGNTLSVPQSLVVAQAQPGVFTVNQQGTGQGSIVKSDQVTLAQIGTPAMIGETVVIYCTGLGAVTPAVKEGSPAPTTPPLSTTVNQVTVTIGGKLAPVAFSGLTPGYAGLYQVNAVVPAGITTGDAVPVVLSVAGQTSPPVTMALR